jgi:septal ring factor EnvC (AmiA/AmiB activator)
MLLVLLNAQDASDPPCWQQLLQHCKDSKNKALRHAAWQSEATYQQLQKLQQQLGDQQQECKGLRDQVASLEGQLARCHSRADEQQQQMEALQAQFAALLQRQLLPQDTSVHQQ